MPNNYNDVKQSEDERRMLQETGGLADTSARQQGALKSYGDPALDPMVGRQQGAAPPASQKTSYEDIVNFLRTKRRLTPGQTDYGTNPLTGGRYGGYAEAMAVERPETYLNARSRNASPFLGQIDPVILSELSKRSGQPAEQPADNLDTAMLVKRLLAGGGG